MTDCCQSHPFHATLTNQAKPNPLMNAHTDLNPPESRSSSSLPPLIDISALIAEGTFRINPPLPRLHPPSSDTPSLDGDFCQFVELHDGYLGLCIYKNGCQYPIEFDRMDTAEKVVDWVRHLCGKADVTTGHLLALVEVATQLGAKTTDA